MSSAPRPSGRSLTALDAALQWAGSGAARLLAARALVLVYAVIGTAAGVTIALLVPNQYVSSAAFITQGSSGMSLPGFLQGAAATLGLDRRDDYSPKFYADLITSRPVLRSAILHPYVVPGADSSHPRNYVEIERLDRLSPALALEAAMKHLRGRVIAASDPRTNMITVSVRARYPSLSRDVTQQLLLALDSLNVGFRQTQSRESREFYETRVAQSRGELDTAEQAVRNFLQRNRTVNSPSLQFELQRLEREAEVKRSLYTTVAQHYEQARLQEARNVPTLTVLSEPFTPVKKAFPPRRFIVVLGLAIGLLVAWTQIALGDAVRRFRADEPARWQDLERQVPALQRLGRP